MKTKIMDGWSLGRVKLSFSLVLVGLLSALIFWSRWIPHPPNFSPLIALCLASGFLAKGRWYSLVLPLGALAISDWQMGFYPGWGVNYGVLVGILFLGNFMRFSPLSFGGFGIFGATSFFLVSNFGVWVFSGMYPPSFQGLLTCYGAGLPFFRAHLLGTCFFMGLFFMGLSLVARWERKASVQPHQP